MRKGKLNILIHSNSQWSGSGYGVQTDLMIKSFRKLGHNVGVSAFYGLQGGPIEHDGIKIFPNGHKPYGNDVLPHWAKEFGADIVITLIDVWVLRDDLHKFFRFVPMSPIDHAPLSPRIHQRTKNAWATIAFSQHACDQYQAAGYNMERVYYVPHAYDKSEMCPVDDQKRRMIRAEFGVPDNAFVIGMVAANQNGNFPTRKGFERILPAIAALKAKGLENLYLYIHTNPGTEMGGIPLPEVIKQFGVDDCVFLPRPGTFNAGGLTREELADLYRSFDVYAMPSMGEGFGVPLIEAQACGVPVMATKFSAMTELTSSGWYFEPVTMVMNGLLSFQALPKISDIIERIEYAYKNRSVVKEAGKRAAKFAEGYEIENVTEKYWKPILKNIVARIKSENNATETQTSPKYLDYATLERDNKNDED